MFVLRTCKNSYHEILNNAHGHIGQLPSVQGYLDAVETRRKAIQAEIKTRKSMAPNTIVQSEPNIKKEPEMDCIIVGPGAGLQTLPHDFQVKREDVSSQEAIKEAKVGRLSSIMGRGLKRVRSPSEGSVVYVSEAPKRFQDRLPTVALAEGSSSTSSSLSALSRKVIPVVEIPVYKHTYRTSDAQTLRASGRLASMPKTYISNGPSSHTEQPAERDSSIPIDFRSSTRSTVPSSHTMPPEPPSKGQMSAQMRIAQATDIYQEEMNKLGERAAIDDNAEEPHLGSMYCPSPSITASDTQQCQVVVTELGGLQRNTHRGKSPSNPTTYCATTRSPPAKRARASSIAGSASGGQQCLNDHSNHTEHNDTDSKQSDEDSIYEMTDEEDGEDGEDVKVDQGEDTAEEEELAMQGKASSQPMVTLKLRCSRCKKTGKICTPRPGLSCLACAIDRKSCSLSIKRGGRNAVRSSIGPRATSALAAARNRGAFAILDSFNELDQRTFGHPEIVQDLIDGGPCPSEAQLRKILQNDLRQLQSDIGRLLRLGNELQGVCDALSTLLYINEEQRLEKLSRRTRLRGIAIGREMKKATAQ